MQSQRVIVSTLAGLCEHCEHREHSSIALVESLHHVTRIWLKLVWQRCAAHALRAYLPAQFFKTQGIQEYLVSKSQAQELRIGNSETVLSTAWFRRFGLSFSQCFHGMPVLASETLRWKIWCDKLRIKILQFVLPGGWKARPWSCCQPPKVQAMEVIVAVRVLQPIFRNFETFRSMWIRVVSYFVCSFDRDVNTKYNLWIAGTVMLQDSMILKFASNSPSRPGVSLDTLLVWLMPGPGCCCPCCMCQGPLFPYGSFGSAKQIYFMRRQSFTVLIQARYAIQNTSSIVYVIIRNFADGFLNHFGPVVIFVSFFFSLPELCGQTNDTLTLTLLCSHLLPLFF